MKIVILSDGFPPYRGGGAETIAQSIGREYVRQGHAVSVITTVQAKEQVGKEELDGMMLHKIHASYPPRWRAYFAIYNPQTVGTVRAILNEERPDSIHVHNIHSYLSYHCLKVAHDLRIPTVVTLHDAMSFEYGKLTQFINYGNLSDRPTPDYKISPFRSLKRARLRYFPLRNLLIRRYLRSYPTAVVSVSREHRKALNVNGVPCTGTIHNGIDLDDFAASPAEIELFKENHGLSGKKIVLFGGRLSYLKGADHFVRAMKHVCAAVPDGVLLVLGLRDGYAEAMLGLARRLGIDDRMVLAGWVTGQQLRAAYGASNVVVVPSICWDSFPTANLEAGAMRKPVVGTCFGGTVEIVLDGETGYIINPLNVESLASRIAELLLDEAKAAQMGEAAYKRVCQEFTMERCVDRYLAIFDEPSAGIPRDYYRVSDV